MRYPMILRAGTWLVAVCAVALAACDQLPTDSATLAGTEIAASGGSWDYNVTGGGDWLACNDWPDCTENLRTIALSATAKAYDDGSVKGQLEFENLTTGTLKFHAEVSCLTVSADEQEAWIGATVSNVQEGDPLFEGNWFVVHVVEGSGSGGDTGHWGFRNQDDTCDSSVPNLAPNATLDPGNFHIRAK